MSYLGHLNVFRATTFPKFSNLEEKKSCGKSWNKARKHKQLYWPILPWRLVAHNHKSVAGHSFLVQLFVVRTFFVAPKNQPGRNSLTENAAEKLTRLDIEARLFVFFVGLLTMSWKKLNGRGSKPGSRRLLRWFGLYRGTTASLYQHQMVKCICGTFTCPHCRMFPHWIFRSQIKHNISNKAYSRRPLISKPFEAWS